MVKAVFQHKADSIHDDTPWEKYNFPKMYLSRIEQTIGDWIIHYEPRSAEGGLGFRNEAQHSSTGVTPVG